MCKQLPCAVAANVSALVCLPFLLQVCSAATGDCFRASDKLRREIESARLDWCVCGVCACVCGACACVRVCVCVCVCVCVVCGVCVCACVCVTVTKLHYYGHEGII